LNLICGKKDKVSIQPSIY